MKKLFWGIPAIGLYFYVATVLTDYGFLTYFNIPSIFVQASLSGNIVFFYQYIAASTTLLTEARWYVLFAIGGAMGIMLGIYYFYIRYSKGWKIFLTAAATFILFLWLGSFFKLGQVIAANQTSFIMPNNCAVGSAYAYIIPVIDGNTTVLVPIDQNHKMTGGFLVKNTSDLSCTFAWSDIHGEVTP